MKKQGFTLIELLAVIVIISIISMIIFPAVGESIRKSQNNAYTKQVDSIEKAAQSLMTENKELIDKYHTNDIYISLKTLMDSKYVDAVEIINPKDKTKMAGCVRVWYDINNKNYNFNYDDNACKEYAKESSKDMGYIIYTYNKNLRQFEKDAENSNIIESIGQFIYGQYKNAIKVIGETNDDLNGLYEDDEYYYFKGSNPNNYLVIEGDGSNTNTEWRILSISKDDYSLKLINTTKLPSIIWTNNENSTDFGTSNINQALLAQVTDDIAYNYPKIINYDYETGKVLKEQGYSINALRSQLSKKTETTTQNSVIQATTSTSNQKVGSISVLDYVNASASSECDSNYLSNACASDNYLKGLLNENDSSSTTWTINNDGTNIWYINSNGSLDTASGSSATKQIYAVVKLADSAISKADNATGAKQNPYKIK